MRSGHVDAVSRKFVAGWAADSAQPEAVLILSIWVDGVRRGMTKANRLRTDLAAAPQWGGGHHGFRFSFGEALSAERDHTIAVRFEDGSLLDHGEQILRGEASETAPAVQTGLMPVLVTGMARSGATLLMSLLAQAPDIVAAGPPLYETRLFTRYDTMFRAVAAKPDKQAWTNPAALTAYTEGVLAAKNAAYAGAAIGAYYRALAEDAHKPGARFFAERSDIGAPSRTLARRACPGLREIFLLRDPRDSFCGLLATEKTPPDKLFTELTNAARAMHAALREAQADTLVLRYEELLRPGTACTSRLAGFLGTTIPPAKPEAAAALFRQHATSASPEASLERWREDLPAALVIRCADNWGDFLDAFGYDVA